MTAESGLIRAGGAVILTEPALRFALDAALTAVKHRTMTTGLPFSTKPYEALACECRAAMAADGHSDVRSPAISDPVPMEQPTVPLNEAMDGLGVGDRQARRLAPKLGGRKIAGRWFIDETALRQHIEGRQ